MAFTPTTAVPTAGEKRSGVDPIGPAFDKLQANVEELRNAGLATGQDYTPTEKTKLSGVATGATANAADALLRDRSTHTGTQAQSTVTGLTTALTGKVDAVGGNAVQIAKFTTLAAAQTYAAGAPNGVLVVVTA